MTKLAILHVVMLVVDYFVQTRGSEQVWAVLGRPVTLNCDSEAADCFLLSPQHEDFYESKRFEDVEVGSKCNLKISSVQEKDFGTWACLVGSKVDKMLEVSRASQPLSVRLERVSETLEARCVVERANPRPKFIWYIDDQLLEDIKATDFEDADNHYQSVFLAPEHLNRKLRCVIDHVSLNEPQEASIVVNLDKDINSDDGGVKGNSSFGIFVGFFALILLVTFLTVMLAWAKNWKLFKREENAAQGFTVGDDSIQELQFDQLQNSRFLIRRLSERQLIQNYGHQLELGQTQSF